MSMDLRRRARPGRKTGDIPPDRTETRPGARAGGRSPGGPAEPRRPFGRMYTRGHRTFWKYRSRTNTRDVTQLGWFRSAPEEILGRTSDGEEPINQKPPQADFIAQG